MASPSAYEETACAGCDRPIRVPGDTSTFTCPRCSAFLSIVRDIDGVSTALCDRPAAPQRRSPEEILSRSGLEAAMATQRQGSEERRIRMSLGGMVVNCLAVLILCILGAAGIRKVLPILEAQGLGTEFRVVMWLAVAGAVLSGLAMLWCFLLMIVPYGKEPSKNEGDSMREIARQEKWRYAMEEAEDIRTKNSRDNEV